jgi:branched-chain amino acid transport system ATP-binding protein
MSLLKISNVTKSFGGVTALSNLDIEVNEQEIVGLIGPNGSGKTTLFNTIMGSVRCDRGTIHFRNEEITGLKPHQICQKGIARTFQLTKPFSRMTCLQNVMVGRCFGSTGSSNLKAVKSDAEEILTLVGLAGKQSLPASTLNLIERKRLELARAIGPRPHLLLLDEIMAGLTPTEIEIALELIRKITRSGVTVVLVEHVMKALLGVSKRVIVLDAGRKIAEGLPNEVIHNPDVIRAYFGADVHA